MPPVALLDANVLFPFHLRDTLLRVANEGCYRAHWSAEILDEMSRNLISQGFVTEENAERLVDAMELAFPDAMVEGWEHREAEMMNDPKDRHVAAAAAHIGASIVVTFNLKDFKNLPAGLTAIGPDDFLVDCLVAMPHEVLAALERQVAVFRKPPCVVRDLLKVLKNSVPRFAAAVDAALTAAGK